MYQSMLIVHEEITKDCIHKLVGYVSRKQFVDDHVRKNFDQNQIHTHLMPQHSNCLFTSKSIVYDNSTMNAVSLHEDEP